MPETKDIEALKNTHLMDWLKQGYTHCQYGGKEWCEAYLTSAHDYIVALEAENKHLRTPPSEDDLVTPAYMAGLEKGNDRAKEVIAAAEAVCKVYEGMEGGDGEPCSDIARLASAIRAATAKEVTK